MKKALFAVFILFLMLIASAVVFFWLFRVEVLVAPIQKAIKAKAMELTGCELKVEKINYNLWGGIVIKGSSLTPVGNQKQPILEIREIHLRINPLKIFTGGKGYSGLIDKIIIFEPKLNITNESLSLLSRYSGKRANAYNSGSLYLAWQDGKVTVNQKVQALWNLNGYLKTNGEFFDLRQSQQGFLNDKFNISVSKLNRESGYNVSASFDFDVSSQSASSGFQNTLALKNELNALGAFNEFSDSIPAKIIDLAGSMPEGYGFSGSVKFSANSVFAGPETGEWTAGINCSSFSICDSAGNKYLSLDGAVSLNKEALIPSNLSISVLDDLILYKAKGRVSEPLGRGIMDVYFEAANKIQKKQRASGANLWWLSNVDGEIYTSAVLGGDYKNPVFSGSISSSRINLPHFSVTSIYGGITASKGKLEIKNMEFSALGGKGMLFGILTSESAFGKLSIDNIDLSGIKTDVRLGISGLINLNADLYGNMASPVIKGGLNYSGLVIGERDFGYGSGRLEFGSGNILLEAVNTEKQSKIYFKAKYENNLLNVLSGKIKFDRSSYIDGSGVFDTLTDEADFNIYTNEINFDDFAIIAPGMKNYSGIINAELRIKGLISDPLVTGRMAVNAFHKKTSLRKEKAVDADFDIEFNKSLLSLRNIKADNFFEGDISVNNMAGSFKNYGIECRLIFSGSDLGYLNAFFDGNRAVSGIAEGSIDLSHKNSGGGEQSGDDIVDNLKQGISQIFGSYKSPAADWNADLRLNVSSFSAVNFFSDALAVEATLQNGIFSLGKLEAAQSSGVLKMSGESDMRYKNGAFGFKVESKQAKYSNLVIDGLVDIKGAYSPLGVKGSAVSPSLWINGIRTGDFYALFNFDGGSLGISEIKMGDLAQGFINFDLKDPAGVQINGGISSELSDIALLNNLFSIETIPDISGPSKFSLKLSGSLGAPQVTFEYELKDNKYENYRFSSYGEGSLKGGVVGITKGGLVIDDDIKLRVQGSQNLSGDKPLNYSLEIEECNIQALSKKFGFLEGLNGDLTGVVELTGSMVLPVLHGKLSADDVQYKQFNFDNSSFAFEYSQNKLRIDEMKIDYQGGSVFLEEGGVLNFLDSKNVKVNVTANLRNISYGRFAVFGALQMEGSISADKQAAGEFTIRANNFWVNQKNFEKNVANISFSGGVLKLINVDGLNTQATGEIDFSGYPKIVFNSLKTTDKGVLTAEVNGYLSDADMNLTGSIKSMDAGAISEFLDLGISVSGMLSSEFTVKGEYASPEVFANIDISNGGIFDIPFVNAGCRFKIEGGLLDIASLRVINQGLFLFDANGRVPLGEEITPASGAKAGELFIDAELEDFGLSIIKAIFPSITSGSGMLAAKLKVRGTKAEPKFWGYVNCSNAQAVSNKYFKKMENLNIYAVLDDYTLDIKNISAKIGNGVARVYGKLKLGWLKIEDMNVVMENTGSNGIPITVPELSINETPLFGRITRTYSKGEPLFSLNLTGGSDNPKLSGWIKLENTFFTYPGVDYDEAEPSEFANSLKRKLFWDINIMSGNNTWFENEYANLKIYGNVEIKGKKGSIEVRSKIESGQGAVGYLGTQFEVSRMLFEIIPVEGDKEADSNIYLEGSAKTSVTRYNEQLRRNIDDEIIMTIPRSLLSEIKPVFNSRETPGLESEKSLLAATGYDTSNLNAQEKELLLRRSIVQIMDATLTTPLARKIARTTGIIDTVSVKHKTIDKTEKTPVEGADSQKNELLDTFLGTKYTVGKHFNPQILLEYSVSIDELQNKLDLRHELELSYSLGRNLYLRGTAQINARDGIKSERKAIIEKQWRFK